MIESAEHIMQAASILGLQHAQILGNQRLMLWYHLGRTEKSPISTTSYLDVAGLAVV